MRIEGVGGVGLNVVEFGGAGPGILLLHGLMDRAATWTETARWLTAYGRVTALDARGHGASDRPDGPYGAEERIGDVIAAIERLGLAPALLIGHSMGGITAWQVAGRRPDLVRAVVIGDIAPVFGDDNGRWRDWFADWPVPFPDADAVRAYFGRDGDFFATVMVPGPAGGLVPPFAFAHMLALRAGFTNTDRSAELDAVRCPALVVGGAETDGDLAAMRAAAARLPHGRYAEVPHAGHVVHHDNPRGWRSAVEPFVAAV